MGLISKKAAVTRISDLLILELKGQRIPTWNEVYNAIGDIPSVPAVPLDKLAAMLSTIGANINCYYCREVLGECTKPPEEREYECDSMAHWAAFLNGWMQKMEEQDADRE